MAKGFVTAVAKYDETVYDRANKNTALPPMRKKTLALRVATTARHTKSQIDQLVNAIATAAADA